MNKERLAESDEGIVMKVKVSELQGAALDWAVAMCEDFDFDIAYGMILLANKNAWGERRALHPYDGGTPYCPSRRWDQGGPIIERERVSIDWDHDCWNASVAKAIAYYSGPTPLIAAMRCYVASKMGDEIEIPDELIQEARGNGE